MGLQKLFNSFWVTLPEERIRIKNWALPLLLAAALPVAVLAQSNAPFTVTGVPPEPASGHWSGGVEGGQAPLGFVEIHGVSAGPFNPEIWEKNQLHWVPDVRMPVLAPRMGGVFRNIYAPNAVEEGEGWRFFYSAWDGIESGTDRVYSATTPDFIDFYDRQTVIHQGVFVHVSNVNVQRADDGSLQMIATCWPSLTRDNKPIYFHSPDGKTWNGSPAPYRAQDADIVKMEGYDQYEKGELNGANVLLYDKGKYTLYFTNWRDGGKVYWSLGETPAAFKFGGVALETEHAVNDMKKFTVNGKDWYVMALDASPTVNDSDKLWFSLSNDGRTFGEEHLMTRAREEMDRYIFAVGFVTRKDRILGVLYGAGPSVRCNRNQIFGYWLQKRVVLTADRSGQGAEYEAQGALGPDRQWIKLPPPLPALDLTPVAPVFEGTLTVFAEDGVTLLGSQPVKLRPGSVYRLDWK
jgi:hypothetical protein